MAVLRDVGQAGQVALADGQLLQGLAVEQDLPLGRRQPGERVDQFALAVAVDARDAHDFTRAHVKGDLVDRLLVPLPVDGEPADGQHRLARLRLLLADGEIHLAPHHHLRQHLDAGVLHLHRADVAPLAQHGAAVGHGHDFRQLVGDEEDAAALACQAAHDAHQLLYLLRGEHGGGLVKNEDVVLPVEHLEDFHPLLHAHGDVRNQGVRVNQQAVAGGQLHHLLPRLLHPQHAVPGAFHAQHDVFQHRKIVHQLEVLVHHADAQGVGLVWVLDGNRLAVLPDFAPVRLVKAEEDAHQRAFAGAVLPQQRVDFPAAQLQGDVVVGADARKILGDAEHLNDVFAHMVPMEVLYPKM